MELNKTYNEDCNITLKRLQDNFIDLTITSPPYNLGKNHHTGNKTFNAYNDFVDSLPEKEYQQKQIEMLNLLFAKTKQGGSLLYNHKNRIKDKKQITPYVWLLKTEWTIKQEIVWFNGSQNFDKCRFYPMTERIYWLSKGVDTDFVNVINQHDLLKDIPEGTNKEHKRAFPLTLAKRFIMCFPNSKIIYDPYMGSGTTAEACIDENKSYLGSEISKTSFDLSKKRIKNRLATPKLF